MRKKFLQERINSTLPSAKDVQDLAWVSFTFCRKKFWEIYILIGSIPLTKYEKKNTEACRRQAIGSGMEGNWTVFFSVHDLGTTTFHHIQRLKSASFLRMSSCMSVSHA